MKFLLHANAPTVPTGYGVQIGQLAERLQAAGHEVAFSSTYGVQGSTGMWKGMAVYPCGFDVNSNDLLHSHADHFFDGDKSGWIITLIDVWAMENPLLAEYNVAAWTPIDHFPIQPGVKRFFEVTHAIPIAMSEWGLDLFGETGQDATYIPLSVNTHVYKPTPTVTLKGKPTSGRELFNVPEDAFVVGMVAMNKGWARDRKGFNEAFWAMGQFMRNHPEVVFYLHTEKFGGAEGVNLVNLAVQCGIQEHRLIWAGGPNQYALRLGFTPQMMALTYSMFDVLLAPSHGEGFCVPLIEAQACGTPVVATNCTAQQELIGQGWGIAWQPEWDAAHHASYVTPFITDVVDQLENAYAADLKAMAPAAVAFAGQYDCDVVFEKYWRPFIDTLSAPGEKLELVREPMPEEAAVAVLCPVLNRPQNVAPLVESFLAHSDGATLRFLVEEGDFAELEAIAPFVDNEKVFAHGAPTGCHTFAEKLNFGYELTDEPWVLCIGDDVRFTEGWLDQARKLSTEFDVIGTNDTAGPVKNPRVANGSHADHFFVRRAYVEEYGACLEGPGVLAPEVYAHWYVDMEMVKLAKARGVFTPCLDSIVEHLHPGFDGREDLRRADATYMLAVESSETDRETFQDRLPLIEMQRTTRARV